MPSKKELKPVPLTAVDSELPVVFGNCCRNSLIFGHWVCSFSKSLLSPCKCQTLFWVLEKPYRIRPTSPLPSGSLYLGEESWTTNISIDNKYGHFRWPQELLWWPQGLPQLPTRDASPTEALKMALLF